MDETNEDDAGDDVDADEDGDYDEHEYDDEYEYDDNEYDDDDSEAQDEPLRRRTPLILGYVAVLVVGWLTALGVLVIRPALTDDEEEAASRPRMATTTSAVTATSNPATTDEATRAIGPLFEERTSEPARSGPDNAASAQVATSEPVDTTTQPTITTTEPRTTEHAADVGSATTTESATTELATTEPATTEPATTEPIASARPTTTSAVAMPARPTSSSRTVTTPPTVSSTSTPTTTAPTTTTTTAPPTTTTTPPTTTTTPPTTTTTPPTTTTTPPTTTTTPPTTTTTPPTTTTARPTTTTTIPPTTAAPTTAATAGATYNTMPDGSPTPVVAIFDRDRITLVGAVPSAQAARQLTALAVANSQFADLPVDNRLTVNPSVPVGVGLRVLELNSVRFAEGSTEITPDHAAQLDRLGAVMNATPNISVVVIGHADQRGTDATNLQLGQQRADAVVAYLTNLGIDGSRLSARSVGEADLLSTGDDEASLALNRRTEFLIHGLLVAPAPQPSRAATTTTAG